MAVSQKRQTLTKRQREIYEFLKEKILNRGYGPTVREIGQHFNIRSPNGVMCHLKALERKGLILRESNMSRAIQLADNSQHRTALPLLGTAISGSPFLTTTPDNTVEFAGLLQPGNRACIRVQGSGFQSVGIQDGDYVIVGKGMTGQPGSLLAGLDDRNCLAITRVPEPGQPDTAAFPGAYSADISHPLGVIVGVVRRFAEAQDEARPTATPAGDDHAQPQTGPPVSPPHRPGEYSIVKASRSQ